MSDLRLHPFALMGGLTAEDLWVILDIGIFNWILMALLPKWGKTAKLSLIFPILHSTLYSLTFLSLLLFPKEGFEPHPDANFFTLKGLVALYTDPSIVFGGILHSIVGDQLLGRWIVLDSQERGASIMFHVLAVVPCLLLTMLFGPLGWLIYFALVRNFLDDPKKSPVAKEKKN